MLKGHK